MEEDTSEEDDNDTDYDDSSQFDDSYDEKGETKEDNRRFKRFRDSEEAPQFVLGMKFGSREEFRSAVIKYGVKQKKLIRFRKNDNKRCRATCDWQTCNWYCLASLTSKSNSWQITSFNDAHCCPPRKDNKLVTSTRIAAKYEKVISSNPMWQIAHLRKHIQEDMCVNVSTSQVKRAKRMVIKKIYDAIKEQYTRIFDYQLELLRSNPGSTVVVKLDPASSIPTFQRIYICLSALKEGFKAGCRKVIGLDGCFFKGATNGELLCALGRDANSQMYPIAWAVVEKETNESWDWFCSLLFKDVHVNDGNGWVIISDQQKGIINAVQNWAPLAEHRNCARHVYANWRKEFRIKDWQKLFWNCAKAPCVSLFNYARAKLARETVEGARAITRLDPKHWSRAWFRLGSNCDSVDNNICESFNKWIIDARFLPIISMLEAIRQKVMVRIQEMIAKCLKWTGDIVCPTINKKLNKYIEFSAQCEPVCNGQDIFEVTQNRNHRFTVDLNRLNCTCGYWQLAGLPCVHAISAIHTKTSDLSPYIASCFYVAAFKRTYAYCLQPVDGMASWPISPRPRPVAPGYVKMPGRPKTQRNKEKGEKKVSKTKLPKTGTIIRCSKCKGMGHNKTTCHRKESSQPAQTVRQVSENSVHISVHIYSVHIYLSVVHNLYIHIFLQYIICTYISF